MSESHLDNIKLTRNMVLLFAFIVPVMLYLLSLVWIPAQIAVPLGVVVFIGMVLLAAALNNTIRNIDRRL